MRRFASRCSIAFATVLLSSSVGAGPRPFAIPNDECANAVAIASVPFTDVLDTTDASSDASDPAFCGGASAGTHSVWYTVTPAAAGSLYATTLGSGFDTALAVYTGSCGALVPLACNDALDGGPTSYVSFPVAAGVPVLIEVLGAPAAPAGQDAGTLLLSVDVVPDKAGAKLVGGCQKALQKAGAKFAIAASKNLDKCTRALFKCLQTASDQASCFKICDECHDELPTSCSGCHTESGPTKKDPFTRLAVAAVGRCNALPFGQVMRTTGIGYDLRPECVAPASVADLGLCAAAAHDCDAGALLATAMPRTRELVEWCSPVPAELDCLPDHGSGGWLGAPAARVVTKCQAAITKATLKLAAATYKSLQTCVAAVFSCVATKNADLKCVNGNELATGKTGGADAKCNKQYAAIAAARARLGPAIDKACGAIPFDALKDPDVANIGALAGECAALGVASLGSLGDYEECLARRQLCVAERWVRFEAPRGESLLQIVNPMPELDDGFCRSLE